MCLWCDWADKMEGGEVGDVERWEVGGGRWEVGGGRCGGVERRKEREMEEGRDKMNGEKTIRPSMLFCGVGEKGEGGNGEE